MINARRQLFSIFLFLALSAPAFSTENSESSEVPARLIAAYPEAPKAELELAWFGTEAILKRNYPVALELIEKFEKEHPESLLSSLGKMFLYHIRMSENFDFKFAKEFEAAVKANDAILKKFFSEKDASRWQLLIAGSSVGMKGIWNARFQRWVKAASNGWDAVEYFRRVKKKSGLTSPFYDVYFGYGLYHYWISFVAKNNNVLRLFPDRRGQGIEELKLAVEKGALTPRLARCALAYFNLLEGNTKVALGYALELEKDYSQNVILRILIGRLYVADGQMERGIEELDSILKNDTTMTYAGFQLARALFLAKRDQERSRLLFEVFVTEQNVERPESFLSEAHFFLAEIYAARQDWANVKNHLHLIHLKALPKSDIQQYRKLKSDLIQAKKIKPKDVTAE